MRWLWLSIVMADRGARRVLLGMVHGYQRTLGLVLGGRCRFVPSCSHYAEEALQRGPLPWALALIVWRLLRCQPFCRGGLDPVPRSRAGREFRLRLSRRRRGKA